MTQNMKQYPTHVTIPTPMPTVLPRGVQARGPHALGPLGANLRVRLSRVDNELVTHIAEELGMKKAEYIRWCAVQVARVLDARDEDVIIVRRKMSDVKHL